MLARGAGLRDGGACGSAAPRAPDHLIELEFMAVTIL